MSEDVATLDLYFGRFSNRGVGEGDFGDPNTWKKGLSEASVKYEGKRRLKAMSRVWEGLEWSLYNEQLAQPQDHSLDLSILGGPIKRLVTGEKSAREFIAHARDNSFKTSDIIVLDHCMHGSLYFKRGIKFPEVTSDNVGELLNVLSEFEVEIADWYSGFTLPVPPKVLEIQRNATLNRDNPNFEISDEDLRSLRKETLKLALEYR
ncbi:hypothetical protein HOF78_01675 [Candidatus Woesearchaeota archaeon]|jgi:hypothetical protein|nr:hypothetical protein [Candidatus Woesearchaeota archaeon]MBT6044785.1 hypothetical protein [Candidatus Woesearchaeota archaeon]